MLRTFVCLGAVLLWTAAAQAVTIDVTISNGTATSSAPIEATDDDGDGIYSYVGDPGDLGMAGMWEVEDISGLFNPDPVVSNSFSISNLLAATQTFTVTVSVVTGPIGAPTTVTGGSAQFGVTDVNGDGATLSTSGAGTALYTALIDGSNFQTLYADPTSVSVGAFLSGNVSPLEDFGTPIPSLGGPAVANSIGIQFQFDLTGNDRATASGVFVVEPVPEPTTLMLVGLGLTGLAAVGRRRAS